MILKDNHYFLSKAQEINELGKPLKQLGISYFAYARHYQDGGRIWLSNNPQLMTSYYENNFHLSGNSESHPSNYKPAVLLWSTLPKQYLYKHCYDHGVYDGMFIVSPNTDGSCEFYGYATDEKNTSIVNTYLTHLDVIRQYNTYFKENAKTILKTSENHRIFTSFHNDPIDFLDELHHTNINEILSQSRSSRGIRLSPRQIECARYLVDGKTSREISEITGLSPRTIEHYVDLLKNKLKCKNRIELILRLNQILHRQG